MVFDDAEPCKSFFLSWINMIIANAKFIIIKGTKGRICLEVRESPRNNHIKKVIGRMLMCNRLIIISLMAADVK